MAKLIVVAQNFDVFDGDGYDSFARTGATSVSQILSAGAQGVILGHSEVGDSPEVINKKLVTIVNKGKALGTSPLTLVVLVGESWSEFEANSLEGVAELMKEKCKTVFKDIPGEPLRNLILGI